MRIISGEWKGRRIVAPKGRSVRPTTDRVREAWMSAMGGRFDGLRVLDLFAGSGALGLECLSRGASEAVFVDEARTSLRALERNVEILGASGRATVVRADALAWVEGLEPRAFDLALADPPYGRGGAARLIDHFTSHPFADELWVEHRTDDVLAHLPEGARQRRYGDTTLTTLVPQPSRPDRP